MKKDLAISLKAKAEGLATSLSNEEREKNFAKESFALEELIPLSESSALGVYLKSPGGKKALVFFAHVNNNYWLHLIVTDSHVLGMGKVAPYLQQVEQHNLKLNWEVV